jgi:5-methylthioadenosine/S-adenosylhomocysteine deaminase
MESIDTLVCARWVLPVEPDGGVLENHAVAIRDGRIVAVAPTAEARHRYDPRETVERPSHALLPGLVNAHASAVLMRDRGERGSAGRWLRDAGGPPGRRPPDPEYVRDCSQLAAAQLLRGGVTCYADAQSWPDIAARAASAAHVRTSVGLIVSEGETGWARSADECIDRGMRLRDEYRGDPLVTMHFAPRAPLATSDATLARVRRLADELDLPVAMRLHQAPWEVAQSLREFGQRPLARLAALGLVSPQLVAVHLTQCEPGDLELLAAAGASVVHCPTANLASGAGLCPVARLLGRGVRVALGTDAALAGGGLDVLAEARLAGLLCAGVAAAPGEVVASDLLRMATLEGARTLGLGDLTGSLLPGKWADLCCLDLRAARSWPVRDVATVVVYAACSMQVTDAWVAGRHVLADARLTQLDEHDVLERAERWRARFAADLPAGIDADD